MINSNLTKVKNCMTLIGHIVQEGLKYNVRIFAKYVDTKSNNLADSLSRFQMDRFWKDVHKEKRVMKLSPDPIPTELWPIEEHWISN